MKHYEVHKDASLALSFSAEPGVLLSTALRPPGFGPPAHPFVNAQSHDARHEELLAQLLSRAKSIAEFIALLEAADFEVTPR